MLARIALTILLLSSCVTDGSATTIPSRSTDGFTPEKDAVDLVVTGLVDESLVCTETNSGGRVKYEACLILMGGLGFWKRQCSSDPNCDNFRAESLMGNREWGKLISMAYDSPEFVGALALAITNTVPILVSTLTWNYYEAFTTGYESPGTDANLCLLVRNGLCGNHVAVAQALASELRLEARSVEFYWTDERNFLSHIMIMVKIHEDWALYDPTYGAYWPYEELSTVSRPLESVLQRDFRPLQNSSLFPQVALDPTFHDFLTLNPSIVIDGEGTIHHTTSQTDLSNLPNYVGWNRVRISSDQLGLQHQFDFENEVTQLQLGIAGVVGEDVQVCLSGGGCIAAKPNSIVNFDLSGAATDSVNFFVASESDIAYAVIENVSTMSRPS